MSKKQKIIKLVKNNPIKIAKILGFDKLTTLHNEWIASMLFGKQDETLQAHRGSYKTTCVSIVLMLIIILRPNKRTAFIRKTDSDVKEIIAQVSKMLKTEIVHEIVRILWGVDLVLTIDNATQISTNLTNDPRGTAQLIGMGIGGSITGKHFDYIFTDDIVNVSDRISKADRERTKIFYQELQNIKNRDGRIFNTGTPWHEEDCFSLMPNIKRYDCYTTGLITEDKLKEIRQSMLPSLFAANYELRYIASEDVIFTNPQLHGDVDKIRQTEFCHIDAAYGGSDYTAFSMVQKVDGKYYVLGKLYKEHVDDVLDKIIAIKNEFQGGKIYNEMNADKGYLSKAIRGKGERSSPYTEKMNKFLKITTYLKGAWNDIIFVEGTDDAYIKQITDFTEDADHDDAPDSLACMIRLLFNKHDDDYRSVF